MTTEQKRERRDYRTADGKRLPSVTTIIGATLGWSKDGLIGWAYRKGIDAMADEMTAPPPSAPPSWSDSDPEAFASFMDAWLPVAAERARAANAHRAQRESAASAGTLAHTMIEARVCGRDEPVIDAPPDVVEAARKAFAAWRSWYVRHDPEIIATEQMLVSEAHGFGGTFDAVARIDGRVILLDWKTGKDVYDDVVIQVGAYDMLCEGRYSPIEAALVVNTPVEGDVQSIEVSRKQLDAGRAAFLSLLSIYKARASMKLAKESR